MRKDARANDGLPCCPNPRHGLMIINFVAFAMGVTLCATGGYVASKSDAQASALALAVLGGAICLLAMLGFQGGRKEKNWMLLVYFYGCVFIAGGLFLFSVAAIAFTESFESYVAHHWDSSTLDYMRDEFCADGTADTKCAVPAKYSTDAEVLAWCEENFDGATDCGEIRDAAIAEGEAWLEDRFEVAGAIGLTTIVLLVAAMHYSVKILTVPIIMKALLDVINVCFFVVGVGVAGLGLYAQSHEDLDAGNDWIAVMYCAVGFCICLLALIGAFGARRKSRSFLAVYIVGVAIVLVLLLIAGVGAWIFADDLEAAYYDKTDGEIQDIACDAGLYGCSGCDLATESVICDASGSASAGDDDDCTTVERCPEWSKDDVIAVIDTNLQFLGLLALITVMFLITGLGGAYVLRQSLAGYQTDSI